MKRIMKCISLAILTVMIAVLIPMSVLADDETRVAINVQIPTEWESPSVWAWAEDGTNAFESWPGGEMEVNPSNDGWYYVWIPDWATHIIINGNEGTVQTDELILDGTNAWVTVSEDGAEISYDQLTEGDTPEYVEKFMIHAKVDQSWESPSLWAWSAPDGTNAFEAWPGEAMTEGETEWYSVKAPIWVNSIIINANEGTVQTTDLAIDPAELWVTVEADGTCEFSYTDPDLEAIPNITISAMVPADWISPSLWAWSAPDGTNVYTTWPGEVLVEGEASWVTQEIPGWVNSVIINANEGTIQTTDIAVDMGSNVWIVVNGPEDFEIYYEEPDITMPEVEEVEEVAEVEELATEPVEEEANNFVFIIYIVIGLLVVGLVAGVVVKTKKNNK